jgi:hypothetical protein
VAVGVHAGQGVYADVVEELGDAALPAVAKCQVMYKAVSSSSSAAAGCSRK